MRHAALALLIAGLAPLGATVAARAETPAPAEAVCQGAAPVSGQTLHGPILHIPGADVVCVATGSDRRDWVAVPLAEAAPARNVLMAAAFGQNATCRIGADGRGDCTIDGDRLAGRLTQGDTLRAAVSWR
jgi:hypothetical protein